MANQGDLPRALRFAVSQIQPGAIPNDESMSAQDKAWLNEVLGQIANSTPTEDNKEQKCARNISDVLRKFVSLLSLEDKAVQMMDAVKSELQHISEEGDLIDLADDSERKNAVAPLSELLDFSMEKCPSMVSSLSSVLAELAQNSAECQEEAMKLIPKLMKIIKNEGFESAVKAKAVYALSAILRGNPSKSLNDALFSIEGQGGGAVDFIVDLIVNKQEGIQVRTKAAFLLSCLVENNYEVRQHLSGKHEIIQNIRDDDEDINRLLKNVADRVFTHKTDTFGKTPLALAM